jgi:hypothetical protein
MNEVTMTQVTNSSNVRAFGYDAATSTLVVVYQGNSRYHYLKVPPERKTEMDQVNTSGGSVGKYLSDRVKGYYEAEKVES